LFHYVRTLLKKKKLKDNRGRHLQGKVVKKIRFSTLSVIIMSLDPNIHEDCCLLSGIRSNFFYLMLELFCRS